MFGHSAVDTLKTIQKQIFVTTEKPDVPNNRTLIIGTTIAGILVGILTVVLILICFRIIYLKRKTYFLPSITFRKQKNDEVCLNEYIRRSSVRATSVISDDSTSVNAAYFDHNLNYISTSNANDNEPKNGKDMSPISTSNLIQSPNDNITHMLENDLQTKSISLGLDESAPESDDLSISCVSSIVDNVSPPFVPKLFSNENDLYTAPKIDAYRKNRMKSSTAAAIAYQKDRDSSVYNDTNLLIGNNDTFIIYKERTAV